MSLGFIVFIFAFIGIFVVFVSCFAMCVGTHNNKYTKDEDNFEEEDFYEKH